MIYMIELRCLKKFNKGSRSDAVREQIERQSERTVMVTVSIRFLFRRPILAYRWSLRPRPCQELMTMQWSRIDSFGARLALTIWSLRQSVYRHIILSVHSSQAVCHAQWFDLRMECKTQLNIYRVIFKKVSIGIFRIILVSKGENNLMIKSKDKGLPLRKFSLSKPSKSGIQKVKYQTKKSWFENCFYAKINTKLLL